MNGERCDGCEKQYAHLPIRVGNLKYHSDSCAHYDVLHREALIRSAKMDSSSSTVDGVQSSQSSNVAEEMRNAHEMIKTEDQEKQKSAMRETLKNLEKSEGNPGENEWSETPIRSEPANANTGQELILSAPSVQRLKNLDQETSDSMNLIDDSIMHLHGLMKCVGKNVRDRAKSENRIGSVDPQAINSAVNCAKQMAEMMKLKILYHKEIYK